MGQAAFFKRIFESLLNALATRLGIIVVVGSMVGACFGLGQYVASVVNHLEANQKVFEDNQIRNGYTAMSDLQRLTEVTKEAVILGGMTPELADRFSKATDILFVRTGSFSRVRATRVHLESSVTAILALEHVVAIADAAIQSNFNDLDQLSREILISSDYARSKLVKFLDDTRCLVDQVLQEQSEAVKKQQTIVIGTLAGLTLVVCFALLFLRREIVGRKAREDAEKRVEFLAFFDPLTELPNRVQFQERFHSLLETQAPTALLFLDLDEFKAVNDTHGHAAGDAILRHTGRILSKLATQYNGFAARLAGDEFAIVVPDSGHESLEMLCQKLTKEGASTLIFEGEALKIHISIGLATTQQVGLQSNVTLDMMSRVADFALYASKLKGRGQFVFYDTALEQRFFERREILEELPNALQRDELEVFLQPKVSLSTDSVFGFEALVRWRRDGELVPPGNFITLAEEAGLVVDIDRFVLKRAVATVAEWNHQHGTDFSISVNLSALHFTSTRIVSVVEQALWDSGLDSQNLTLEITETSEMRDWKQAQHTIKELHSLGCRIAIDDFGTGFSSLAYLRATLADELKVDRSLVTELETSQDARLLLSSVFDIARNLKMDITVEGIETSAQANIVRSLGVANAQGFLFGRPNPPELALASAMPQTAPFKLQSH